MTSETPPGPWQTVAVATTERELMKAVATHYAGPEHVREIGAALGVTRQAVEQRWPRSRPTEEEIP